MGKYTEALRKIEEERVKKVPDPKVLSHNLDFRNYAIGISVVGVVIIILVYSYGVYSGSRSKKPVPAEISVASPVQQVSNADQNAMLLENVEKMMQLPLSQERPVIKPEVNAQVESTIKPEETGTPNIETPAPKDFYTIQLVAYEQESMAKLEARKLLAQGYKPLILRSSNFFKVCIGKFPIKEQAELELQRIKTTFDGRTYYDAFIRLVKAKTPNLTGKQTSL